MNEPVAKNTKRQAASPDLVLSLSKDAPDAADVAAADWNILRQAQDEVSGRHVARPSSLAVAKKNARIPALRNWLLLAALAALAAVLYVSIMVKVARYGF